MIASEHNSVRFVPRKANVSAPGEGISSRSLSGAAYELRPQTSPETGSEGDPCPTSGERDMAEAGTGQNSAVLPQEPCKADIIQSAAIPAETAPANPAPPPATAGAVEVSDATMFALDLIAAREGMLVREVLDKMVSEVSIALGLSPALLHAASETSDLSGLPNYARSAAKRCRGGVP